MDRSTPELAGFVARKPDIELTVNLNESEADKRVGLTTVAAGKVRTQPGLVGSTSGAASISAATIPAVTTTPTTRTAV